MTASCPIPPAVSESRQTATRRKPGDICLSSSSHFPASVYSNLVNPVALPPGCARLSTKPPLTGSVTLLKTTGIFGFNRIRGAIAESPEMTIASGASATSRSASRRTSIGSLLAQFEIDLYFVPTRHCQFVHYLDECRSRTAEFRFVLPYGNQDADAAHLLTLLRRRHE